MTWTWLKRKEMGIQKISQLNKLTVNLNPAIITFDFLKDVRVKVARNIENILMLFVNILSE